MTETTRLVQAPQRLREFARWSAAVGVVVWVLLVLTTATDAHETELIHKVVFFAFLVIVPLGLSLTLGEQTSGLGLYRAAVFVHPLAPATTIASLFVEKGAASAALAAVWFVFTAVVALFGLTRLLTRGLYPLPETSIDAGLLYLPVGGAWLIVYRLGVQPFGYGETIILLTVVHFHFAGFATPIIAGLNGRVLTLRKHPQKIFSASVFAIGAAMPLGAAGITFSPWIGFAGAVLLSAGLWLLAVLTVGWVMPAVQSSGRRFLLLIGALSSCSAMVLACLYAYSLAMKTLIVNIPTMAMTHGLLNAFGFVTCSLLAWTVITLRL